MPALLALIPGKDWLYGGAIVLLLLVGLHYHNKLLAEGIAEQKAADTQAAVILEKQTADKTAELQARATMAEQAYDKEVNSLSSVPVPVVRLCVYPHSGGSVVSQAGSAQPGAQSASAAAGNIQPMPSGNSGSGSGAAGRDIGPLLGALARAADRSDAALREYQSR